jgi:DHA1 family multidrug resistance protein-like MFS transporter
LAQSAEQLTLLRAVQGVLSGTIAAANALVAGSAPREHSGEALGLMQMGVWVGVAVGPLIGGVIGDLFGFRESFWLTGALLGLAGVAVIFWVQEDFTPPPPQERAGFLNGYRALLRAPSMIGLYSLAFLQSLGQTIILPIAALFVGQLMGPASAVATVTGLLMGTKALAGSLSAVWLGRLSDRVGHRKVLLFSAAAALLVYLPQPFVSAAWQLVVLQGLLGLANGGIIPATNALLNLHSPPGRQGATFGLSTSVNSAARSVAPILGALIAIWFGKRGVFGAAALVYGLLALLSFYIRRAGPPAGSSAGPGARDSISARSSPSSGKATPL